MALPTLIAGTDCGPVNPLQGLAKRFDQDRGIQQDQFVAGRAGPSRETFRTSQPINPALEQEAARFFSSGSHVDLARSATTNAAASAAAFDLSLLHSALPAPNVHNVGSPIHANAHAQGGPPQLLAPAPVSVTPAAPGTAVTANWAADFLRITDASSSATARPPGVVHEKQPEQVQQPGTAISQLSMNQVMSSSSLVGMEMPWTLAPMSMMPGPQQLAHHQVPAHTSSSASAAALWDKEFQAHETASKQNGSSSAPPSSQTHEHEKPLQDTVQEARRNVDADELACTAGMLIDALRYEQNPKFKNSKFLAFMRHVRDGEVVVDGNDLVPRSEKHSIDASASAYTSTDVKGKGKERAFGEVLARNGSGQNSVPVIPAPAQILESQQLYQEQTNATKEQTAEDANEAYFRQENEEYIKYWEDANAAAAATSSSTAMSQSVGVLKDAVRWSTLGQEWGEMQESWDSFEATTTGIKPVAVYRFQQHNPYLLGIGTMTSHHHSMHTTEVGRSIYDSVLELEARVQRDPTSARAWYDLGVKQQENERETKAMAALKRAVQLDAKCLPAWLALAISHTNESNRFAANEAIEQWIRQNGRYEAAVRNFFARTEKLNGDRGFTAIGDGMSARERLERRLRRHNELIQCLMAMARFGARSDGVKDLDEAVVDADVQIALAVLLNGNGEYLKSQDCFKAALSARPDDWQLYNCVGATLANSGFSEEAFQYYYRALELNPTYIRARFNLGISCMNMRKYEEAANYIFDALIMQDSDRAISVASGGGRTSADVDVEEVEARGMTSAVLWGNLRTSCLQLQRTDLATLCDQRDLEGFRRAFRS